MSMLILPKLKSAGRLSPYILRKNLIEYFRSLVVTNTFQKEYVQDILAPASPYFTPTGTVYMGNGLHGKGFRGDGSTGLWSRNTNIPAQPLWMIAVFQARTVSTPIKTIASLGAGDASTSYSFICSGNGTLSNIRGAVRGDTSGGTVNILGPVPEVNKLYSVVFSAPSNLLADGYLYVNGVKYTEPAPNAGNATFTNTWIYQAIGALKRNTTALFSDDFIYLTGYGLGEIPEALARDISANPWHIFESGKRFVYFDVAASRAVDLSGNATAQVTATAQLTQQIQISGAAIATATATGVLNQALALSGSAAAITTASGNIDLTVSLTGSALAQAIGSADFGGANSNLAGQANAQMTASGNINLSLTFAGIALAQSLANANLTVSGANGLSGNAQSISSATGSLGLIVPLLGNSSAVALASGNISTSLPITGSAVSVANGSGNMTLTVSFSENVIDNVLASGSLLLNTTLSGSALVSALASAMLNNGTNDYSIPVGKLLLKDITDHYAVHDITSRYLLLAA